MNISGSHLQTCRWCLLGGIPCRNGRQKCLKRTGNQDVSVFCGDLKCMGGISANPSDVKSVYRNVTFCLETKPSLDKWKLFFFPRTVRVRVDDLPFTKHTFLMCQSHLKNVGDPWGAFLGRFLCLCVWGDCISSHFVFAETEQRLCYSQWTWHTCN